MCELFALSASAPIDIKLSLAELARHGGDTGIHADGWGVAFVEGRDARLFREPAAAASSAWVECLQSHPIRSDTIIAHIRHATQGAISLANTQPFVRELGGRMHVFAHSGRLEPTADWQQHLRRIRPVGDTDSEVAFCRLLELLAARDDSGPDDDGSAACEVFASFAQEARRCGPANLILACDGRLLVHADRRTQATGHIEPPGLWLLRRHCAYDERPLFDHAGVHVANASAVDVVLVASVPLSGEPWQPLPQGAVLAIERGKIVRSRELRTRVSPVSWPRAQ